MVGSSCSQGCGSSAPDRTATHRFLYDHHDTPRPRGPHRPANAGDPSPGGPRLVARSGYSGSRATATTSVPVLSRGDGSVPSQRAGERPSQRFARVCRAPGLTGIPVVPRHQALADLLSSISSPEQGYFFFFGLSLQADDPTRRTRRLRYLAQCFPLRPSVR
jgi:hypothetical protein